MLPSKAVVSRLWFERFDHSSTIENWRKKMITCVPDHPVIKWILRGFAAAFLVVVVVTVYVAYDVLSVEYENRQVWMHTYPTGN